MIRQHGPSGERNIKTFMTHSGDSAHGWYLVPIPPLDIIRVETADEARNAPTGRRVILEMPGHVAEDLGFCFDDATTWEEALWDADAPIDENGVVVDCRHGAASPDVWSDMEIDWDQFPAVYADSAYADYDASQRMVLVFRPKNCYEWKDRIGAWHKILQGTDDMDMLGVIEVPYKLSGRRLARQEGLPFPVLLDSTGWFSRRFGVSRTPFLILVSSSRDAHLVRMSGNAYQIHDKVTQLIAEMLPDSSN